MRKSIKGVATIAWLFLFLSVPVEPLGLQSADLLPMLLGDDANQAVFQALVSTLSSAEAADVAMAANKASSIPDANPGGAVQKIARAPVELVKGLSGGLREGFSNIGGGGAADAPPAATETYGSRNRGCSGGGGGDGRNGFFGRMMDRRDGGSRGGRNDQPTQYITGPYMNTAIILEPTVANGGGGGSHGGGGGSHGGGTNYGSGGSGAAGSGGASNNQQQHSPPPQGDSGGSSGQQQSALQSDPSSSRTPAPSNTGTDSPSASRSAVNPPSNYGGNGGGSGGGGGGGGGGGSHGGSGGGGSGMRCRHFRRRNHGHNERQRNSEDLDADDWICIDYYPESSGSLRAAEETSDYSEDVANDWMFDGSIETPEGNVFTILRNPDGERAYINGY